MDDEKIHFYFFCGIISIIVGVVSLVYSFSIPTKGFSYNIPVSLTFIIIGLVFILMGTILLVIHRRKSHSQKQNAGNENG